MTAEADPGAIARLTAILHASPLFQSLFVDWPRAASPLWIGAGAIAQTVWNHRFARPPLHGLKDVDLVWFDAAAGDAEEDVERRLNERLRPFAVTADAKNQALVHRWYAARFGHPIPPYRDLADAIATWPTTATAVAIRPATDSTLQIIAPFGLDDLLAGRVRPNHRQITPPVYAAKVTRWTALWPGLSIRPWAEGVRPPA
ncbi:MAG: nucleotidyltransferase family protein [Alphaproteobacteria bacterium]